MVEKRRHYDVMFECRRKMGVLFNEWNADKSLPMFCGHYQIRCCDDDNDAWDLKFLQRAPVDMDASTLADLLLEIEDIFGDLPGGRWCVHYCHEVKRKRNCTCQHACEAGENVEGIECKCGAEDILETKKDEQYISC